MVGRATERNKRLGAALRKAREAAGLNQGVAAQALGYSQSTITRIESGDRELSSDELQTLLGCYHPIQTLRDDIEQLTTLPDTPIPDHMPRNPHFVKMLRAVEDATEVLSFHSERIPMPLQTDQYALQQYELVHSPINGATVLRAWEGRRRILTRETPPRYRAILAMSALERMPGGRIALVKEQAQHLLELIDTFEQFSLQVLHTKAKLAYVDTDFTLVKVPRSGRQRNLVYVPFGLDGALLEKPWQVRERERYWHMAHQAALSEDDSKKLIHDLARYGLPD